MSKFKVIEESRFLKNNLMKEITGGVIINSGTCTILSAHDGCGGSSRIFTTCKESSVAMYESTNCGSVLPYVTCTVGMLYEHSTCGQMPTYMTWCPGQADYNGIPLLSR